MSLSTVDPAVDHAAVGSETCVACGGAQLEPFLDLGHVPIETTCLYHTRTEAVDAPMGRMVLQACPRCGLVRNVAFEPEAVAYTTEYENSQHFSPTFQRYAEQLVDRLIETYGLRGGRIAEIGCGKGEFLALLCERAQARGIGFDPTYDGEVDASAQHIEIRREFFPGSDGILDVQLVACRHVLEHVAAPDELLRTVAESLPGPGPAYFEVPNASHVFSPSGMWDLIYQHVSYFDARSMWALFTRCGFDVTRLAESFRGQFLSLDAVPAEHPAEPMVSRSRDTGRFAATFRHTMDFWERFAVDNSGRRVVLWGAGAKGVSFLNLTSVGQVVYAAVDVNPRKQGSFVPGTGQEVLAPDDLRDDRPDVVLVANPAYEWEIRSALSDLGVKPIVTSL
ncbi:MAG: class I SAM-dependent methyltransferase [Actinobacteria bacterium]|nr:class I SAM-dependent methyltransferase [Actinomycetota bacterium]